MIGETIQTINNLSLEQVPIGAIVELHHGIKGEWEVIKHQTPPVIKELGERIDVRRVGSDSNGTGIPISYVKKIISKK